MTFHEFIGYQSWVSSVRFVSESKPVRYAATTPDAESMNKDKTSSSSSSSSSSSDSSSDSSFTDSDEKDKNSTVVGFKNEPTFTVNL